MIEHTIEVQDKNGKKIAIFSNQTSAHTEEAKRNLMISPIINIVSNGESTLSFQMFANSEKWQQIKNPENLYYCNHRVYTALNEQSIVYQGDVVNVTLVELWYLLSTKFVTAHNVDTFIEGVDVHTVKILPKTESYLKLTVNGVQYNDSDVRDARDVVMPRGSAGYALWALLKGTDWKLGVCDVIPDGFSAANDYGTFNVESDMKSVLENIQYVQELYGGILDWDSEHKILNLRDETKSTSDFNTWKGVTFRKGKNLAEAPKIVWDNNIITRLYPLGNGNLNIRSVNGDKGYVDNFSYTNTIYEGYIQNTNIYDTNDEGGQKSLKFWAESQLKDLCHPRKTISYSVIDIRQNDSNQFETFDINDIVKCYYRDTEDGREVSELLRIQHLSYNWFYYGTDSVIEVGDKISNEREFIYQVLKSYDSSISDYSSYFSDISAISTVFNMEKSDRGTSYISNAGFEAFADETMSSSKMFAEFKTDTSESLANVEVKADENGASIENVASFMGGYEDENGIWHTVESTSGFTTFANKIMAGSSTFAEYKTDTSDAIHQVDVKLTETGASVNDLLQFKTETTDAIASISRNVDANSSSIKSVASFTGVTQGADGSWSLNTASAEFDSFADSISASNKMQARYPTKLALGYNPDPYSGQQYVDGEWIASFDQFVNTKFANTTIKTAFGYDEYGPATTFEQYVSEGFAATYIVSKGFGKSYSLGVDTSTGVYMVAADTLDPNWDWALYNGPYIQLNDNSVTIDGGNSAYNCNILFSQDAVYIMSDNRVTINSPSIVFTTSDGYGGSAMGELYLDTITTEYGAYSVVCWM